LPVATQNFEAKQCQLETLANYEILLNRAIETNYISKDELDTLQQWRENPQEWATHL
jgi:orotate phosphoribosyltransferase